MDYMRAAQNFGGGGGRQLPESPRQAMEFLSRSWRISAMERKALAAALATSLLPKGAASFAANSSTTSTCSTTATACSNAVLAAHENMKPIREEEVKVEDSAKLISGNTFFFASSATSQLLLECIIAQTAWQEVSPLTGKVIS
ncbi:hypothetical protein ACH5RR_020198 [Cinchona calisaya]|uniref:VAN3-binding protein-like auxin canalisation domain-containing protein n=1 Tax=Cinchona calisaya TaxID=153742 RepID=A0ABD2ZET6_9GENT